MSARKSSHGTIFLIVASGSPLALIASSLRSTSKKPFCPIRSLHPLITACGHRVTFLGTWREEFFEAPINTLLEEAREGGVDVGLLSEQFLAIISWRTCQAERIACC